MSSSEPATWLLILVCDVCGGDEKAIHGVPPTIKRLLQLLMPLLFLYGRIRYRSGPPILRWEPEERPSMLGEWDFSAAHQHSF